MKHFYTTTALIALLLLTFLGMVVTGGNCTSSEPGHIYYVAKDGLDSNPGTEAQPWLTIQQAANTMVAGDLVYVKAGIYNESIVPAQSGNKGNWITYRNYPGDTVVIDGSSVYSPWGLIDIDGKSYLNIEGFQLLHSSSNGIILHDEVHFVVLKRLKIDDIQWSGIQAAYNWAVPPPQNMITDILIDGCEISNTNKNGMDESISLRSVHEFEIMNCRVHDVQSNKEGIDTKLGCSNGLIHRNEIYNAKIGIYMDASTSISTKIDVYNNEIHDCTDIGIGISSEGASPVTSENGDPITDIGIYNNLIYNNNWGISALDYDFYRTFSIINNTVYDNTYGGIALWASGVNYRNCLIRNNIIANQRESSYMIIYPDYPAGVKIDHNLYYALEYKAGNVYGTYYILGTDPQLTNPIDADFRLMSNSPAIDNGSSSGAPNYDFAGTSRPQGKEIDIGAYELNYEIDIIPSATN